MKGKYYAQDTRRCHRCWAYTNPAGNVIPVRDHDAVKHPVISEWWNTYVNRYSEEHSSILADACHGCANVKIDRAMALMVLLVKLGVIKHGAD